MTETMSTNASDAGVKLTREHDDGTIVSIDLTWPEANHLSWTLRQACINAGLTVRHD